MDRGKVIKGMKMCISPDECSPDDCPYYIRPNNESGLCWDRLMTDALALLKQEAKTVEICGQMFTIKYGHCPTCGEGIDSETYPQWCGFCGQELKWNE